MSAGWNPFAFVRRTTRTVWVGDVAVGGGHPIRVQSMTTTDTRDVEATVAQVERLARAGCEIVRITAPGIREAESLAAIKRGCRERGVTVPLVADIHFTPNAAMEAALHVEKVRINPGNYADRKRFEVRDYSEAEYSDELARVAERFRPLVRRCRELGRALRIGTNHGSLSDRIMNRFGDTPLGMVESALEFLEVCEAEDYRDVIFSMKASNPRVAIHAYRLLALRLAERAGGWDRPSYPFHIGVTEAGSGEEGRVKSAIGIGALLEDGIGDTLRVSLTEDPVREVPVARALAARYETRRAGPGAVAPGPSPRFDPTSYARRATRSWAPRRAPGLVVGDGAPVRVELDLGPLPKDVDATVGELVEGLSGVGELACEGLSVDLETADQLAGLRALAQTLEVRLPGVPLAARAPAALAPGLAGAVDRVVMRIDPSSGAPAALPRGSVEWCFEAPQEKLGNLLARCFAERARPDLVSFDTELPTQGVRFGVAWLEAHGLPDLPLVLRHRGDPLLDRESAVLRAATDLGGPLCDGIGDLVVLGGLGAPGPSLALAYRILQGARQRSSWTEFISCPSCGRTLFDLEETTARIQQRTAHLPGLKIAVMGCIVNGPGEMADADFGYVGSGIGKVNLYVGRECVVRNVPEATAPDRLVDLIRDHGRWTDAPAARQPAPAVEERAGAAGSSPAQRRAEGEGAATSGVADRNP